MAFKWMSPTFGRKKGARQYDNEAKDSGFCWHVLLAVGLRRRRNTMRMARI